MGNLTKNPKEVQQYLAGKESILQWLMGQVARAMKGKAGLKKTSKGSVEMTQYKKRLEEAVSNAQYMMIYASTHCKKDIDQETMKKLINARHHVEQGLKLSATAEADFWFNYQKLWKLVEPANAESIIANLPVERTFFGRLFGSMPVLSQWAEKLTTSKARKSVNRYITFTAAVLILLLVFQIYWVVGNQLTTQLNDLLEKRADLTLELNTNQKEYSTLETRYMQDELDSGKFNGAYTFDSSPVWRRDTLENKAANASINTDLESLNSQIDRNLNVLTAWSCPWASLINAGQAVVKDAGNGCEQGVGQDTGQAVVKDAGKEDKKYSPKYQPLINSIVKQINDVKDQLNQVGNDENTASIQNNPIKEQLGTIEVQLTKYATQIDDLKSQQTPEIKKKRIGEISDFQIKRGELLKLWAQWNLTPSGSQEEASIQSEIDKYDKVQIDVDRAPILLKDSYDSDDVFSKLDSEKSNLENEFTTMETQLVDIQEKMDNLNSQKDTLEAHLITAAEIRTQWQAESDKLNLEKEKLISQEEGDVKRESSLADQLAGQSVLNILQSYILPILYGLLGAGTSVLRSLSRKIKDVTYSGVTEIQHILSISLGALAGIMVGWFSFLIDAGTTTFLGSVSPLAIAFLVGYNIEPFFSRMDDALKMNKKSRQAAS